MQRCGWVSQDPLYIAYHDKEWGIPETDGKKLFEMICLEGQQAGLSWITVLKKRENYRQTSTTLIPFASRRCRKTTLSVCCRMRALFAIGENSGHHRQCQGVSRNGAKWRTVC